MIYLKANTAALTRDLSRARREQVPFATATAVNKIAKRVTRSETEALSETFKSPRPFTKSAFTQSASFGGSYASKRNPIAIVVAKPAQAAYLAPSEEPKSPQFIGAGKRIRTPVDIKTDASGDIPKGSLARLLASPDCFLGVIGGINGIWQRPTAPRPKGSPRGPKRTVKPNTSGRLRLLVAFTRPVPVRTDLHYRARAQSVIDAHWSAEFAASLREAMATAR